MRSPGAPPAAVKLAHVALAVEPSNHEGAERDKCGARRVGSWRSCDEASKSTVITPCPPLIRVQVQRVKNRPGRASVSFP
jgi:hypothetical protein